MNGEPVYAPVEWAKITPKFVPSLTISGLKAEVFESFVNYLAAHYH